MGIWLLSGPWQREVVMRIIRFMQTATGRAARAAAGLILVAVGAWLGGAW
jgi:hypothetical protein